MPKRLTAEESPAVARYEEWQAKAGETLLLRITPKDHLGVKADLHLHFPVKVIEARLTFGRVRVLIEPVGGRGQQWVLTDRLEMK